MRDLVDTIFHPFLNFLDGVRANILNLSVPLAKPLDFSRYFGQISFLGPVWETFITTSFVLLFIYFLVYVIVNNLDLIIKFKNLIKWW